MAKKIKTIKKYQNRKVKLDPLYQSLWLSKFTNKFMLQGRKHVVERIMYKSFYKIKTTFHRQPLKLLFKSLIKLKPLFGFVDMRFGKTSRRIPIPLEPRRQLILALKALVWHTKTESYRTLEARLIRVFSSLLKKKNSINKIPTRLLRKFSPRKSQYSVPVKIMWVVFNSV